MFRYFETRKTHLLVAFKLIFLKTHPYVTKGQQTQLSYKFTQQTLFSQVKQLSYKFTQQTLFSQVKQPFSNLKQHFTNNTSSNISHQNSTSRIILHLISKRRISSTYINYFSQNARTFRKPHILIAFYTTQTKRAPFSCNIYNSSKFHI